MTKVHLYPLGKLFLLSLVAFVCAGCARGTGNATNEQNGKTTVTAEAFILKNKDGQIIAMLDTSPAGTPIFAMFDQTNQMRTQIALSSEGTPWIQFFDADGKRILELPDTLATCAP